MAMDENVCMISSLIMKVGSTIMIQGRSVKVKFGWQAMILAQPKFAENVVLTNTCFAIFLMKSDFSTIILLANSKTVPTKCYANEHLSNVLKQVGKDQRLKSLIIHHDNPLVHRAAQTQMLNTLS
jgi:hypothetical protein